MGTLIGSELSRLYRSPRFLIFTIGFPVVYFLLFSAIYATGADTAATTIVLMVAMGVFGAINASTSTGSRVAIERGIGWNRQLQLTPLPAWAYLAAKAAVAMLVTLPALVLVFAVGVLKGVDLAPLTWLAILLTAWIGTAPFAAIGLLLGMVSTPDSAQGTTTVVMLLFTLLGGVLIPATVLPPTMTAIAHALPSFWVVETAVGEAFGGGVSAAGLAVVAAWLAVAGALVVLRYRRAAARV